MDWPKEGQTPLFVTTFSRWSGAFDFPRLGTAAGIGSITWPVANTGFYIPIFLPFPYEVKRVFWVNGSSVTSVSNDFGIYTADGVRLYSTTSTAQSGASVPQYTTPGTSLLLPPGAYYFALSCTSTTANRGGQGNTGVSVVKCRLAGLLQQASVATLPATMTGAAVSNACVPLCGITRTASGFA